METSTKDLAVGALGKLAQAICGGKPFTHKQYAKIAEVLDALSEKPESLSIDRSKLEVVWSESERYLGANRSGYLLVLINGTQRKKEKALRSQLVKYGISNERICIITTDNVGVEEILSSHKCRAVLYEKGAPNKFVELISEKTSARLNGLEPMLVKRALAELAKKLE